MERRRERRELKPRKQLVAAMETKSKEIRYESANRWSQLPRDLLGKILEKLCFSDFIRAAATCKDWNISARAISRSLPWIVGQDWSVVTGSINGRPQLSCKLNLYEALNPRVYKSICRTFDLASGGGGRFEVDGPAQVRDTKLGWVLVEIRTISGKGRSYSLLVLCSPFVQDEEDCFWFLPGLKIPVIHMATFSGPPTSKSDCVVYALITEDGNRPFRIHSWRCNDHMNWKVASYDIDNGIPNHKLIGVVAMEDGTLYCLGESAKSLIAFNSSNNSIQLQTTVSEPPVDLFVKDITSAQLAVHEGEMFLVCCCCCTSTSTWYHMIYWYDTSANCWFLKQRLDHRKSFARESYNSALVTASGPAAMPMANQVNVWRREGRFSCLEDGKPDNVTVEELFPFYHRDSGVKPQLLSMGEALHRHDLLENQGNNNWCNGISTC